MNYKIGNCDCSPRVRVTCECYVWKRIGIIFAVYPLCFSNENSAQEDGVLMIEQITRSMANYTQCYSKLTNIISYYTFLASCHLLLQMVAPSGSLSLPMYSWHVYIIKCRCSCCVCVCFSVCCVLLCVRLYIILCMYVTFLFVLRY